MDETDGKTIDLENIMDDSSEDKVFAAMGVAKTITTVCHFILWFSYYCSCCSRLLHLLILLRRSLRKFRRSLFPSLFSRLRARYSVSVIVANTVECTYTLADLFDNMYELADSLTFKLRAIAPNMWPVFELTYKLFKSDAVDFLDGTSDGFT